MKNHCLFRYCTEKTGPTGHRVHSIWFCLLILIGRPPIAEAQDTLLTLSEAISIALEQNIQIQKSALDISSAENRERILRAGLQPQLSLATQLPNFYKSTSPVIQPNGSIYFQPITQDNSLLSLRMTQKILPTNTMFFAEANVQRYQDFTDDFIRFNTIPFRMGLTQPLNQVNYDRWDQRFSRLDREIADRHLSADREKIAAEVTAAFFEVLMAQIDQEIASTNQENNQRLYDIAKERYALGKISKSDLLQLELGLSNAVQNELKARRSLIRSGSRLKEIMNHRVIDDSLPAVEPPGIPHFQPVNPAEAAALAWKNRPEQREFRKLMLEAEQAMEIADRENGWQAQLTAQIGFTGSGSHFGDSYRQTNFETMAEIRVQVPLLDGKKRKLSMSDARSRYAYYESETEFTEEVFRQNVRQLVQQFNQLQKEAEQARKSYEVAGQRYAIVNQRYVLDDISITDLTLAFGERDQAWRNYIGLLQAFWTTYYTIRQLTLYDFEQNQNIQ